MKKRIRKKKLHQFLQEQIETIETTNEVSNAVKKNTKSLYEQLFKSDLIISKLTIEDGCSSFSVNSKVSEYSPFDVIVSPSLIKFGYYFCGEFELRYKGSSNNIQGAVEFIKNYLK
jgi:hypothetical protein